MMRLNSNINVRFSNMENTLSYLFEFINIIIYIFLNIYVPMYSKVILY